MISKLTEAEQEQRALIQMYQAGFLDGVNAYRKKNKLFVEIGDKCKRAFEHRYIKAMDKGVKKVNGRHKN